MSSATKSTDEEEEGQFAVTEVGEGDDMYVEWDKDHLYRWLRNWALALTEDGNLSALEPAAFRATSVVGPLKRLAAMGTKAAIKKELVAAFPDELGDLKKGSKAYKKVEKVLLQRVEDYKNLQKMQNSDRAKEGRRKTAAKKLALGVIASDKKRVESFKMLAKERDSFLKATKDAKLDTAIKVVLLMRNFIDAVQRRCTDLHEAHLAGQLVLMKKEIKRNMGERIDEVEDLMASIQALIEAGPATADTVCPSWPSSLDRRQVTVLTGAASLLGLPGLVEQLEAQLAGKTVEEGVAAGVAAQAKAAIEIGARGDEEDDSMARRGGAIGGLGIPWTRFLLRHVFKYLDVGKEVIPEEMLRIQKFFSAVLPFKPRLFQLRMLTAIRNGQSVVATAPTSYGKSFGGLYAAAWALTANATAEAAMGPDAPHSVVAIIVPTQSLCDQTLADCYARMQKLQNTVVKSGETIVGFRTKLYNQDVDVCRMLVATPHHFEELLLQGWPGRGRVLKCVVIDEFHEIANPHARILTLIDCPYVLLSATMNNPVEVTEQLELLEKEKMKRGLIGERMRQPIVLEEDNGDEDAMVDEIVGDAHSIGRQVILVPPDGRMLYRPIDLVWFRADPPPLELSVVAKPRKRFEEVKEDRSTFIPMNRVCAKDGEEIVRQQLPAPEALSLWELLNPDTAVAGPPAFTSLFPDKGEVRNWIDTVKTQFTDSSAAVKSSVLGRLAPQPASERAAASVAIAEAVTGTVDLTESNDGGVMKTIIVQGTGIKALKGSTVFVHYTGSLIGGEVFDTSRDYEHAKPMKIVVGAGVVVAGMDLAVESMCVGEQAKFFFRADYAYGDEGSAGKSGMQVDIPANADIEFVVELMSVGESEDLGEARAGAPTGDPALDGITSLLIQATLQGMTPVIVFNPDVDKLMQLVERVANEFDEAERLLKETKEWQDKEANREEGLARALRILKGGNDTSPEYRDALETYRKLNNDTDVLEEFSFAKEGAQVRKAATDYLTRPKRRRIRNGTTDSRIPGFSKDHVLIRAFRRGVGLHTYNTDEERPSDVHWQKYQSYLQNVESSLRTRHLSVVFCSESLALGVNLPVKSVIVAGDSPRLNPTTLRHMVGRAGRWGLDLEGSAIFLGISPERQNELMTAPVADVRAGSPASWIAFDECALGVRERRKFCKIAARYTGGEELKSAIETLKEGPAAAGYASALEVYTTTRLDLAMKLGSAQCAQLTLASPDLFVNRSESDEGGHHHAPVTTLPAWIPELAEVDEIVAASLSSAQAEVAAAGAIIGVAGDDEDVEAAPEAAKVEAPDAPETFELGSGDSDDWEDSD